MIGLEKSNCVRLARLKRYFRENWGAPFVIGFMVLLLVSAAYLSLGLQIFANEIAFYAFYLLVAGVGLQISSYIKYGEGKPKEIPYVAPVVEPLPKGSRTPTRVIAFAILVVVIVGTLAVVQYPQCLGCKPPSVTLSFANSFKEPDGSTIERFGLTVFGCASPCSFTARWSDAFVQTNTLGLFTRTFLSNQTVSHSASVTVMGNDGQRAGLNVTITSP